MAELRVTGVRVVKGEARVPGDKSITHRAMILSALAEGVSTIEGWCRGEDNLRTLEALKKMGVPLCEEGSCLVVEGKGLFGLREPADVLDAGNSGTTIRLLTGVLAGQDFFSAITGDLSLRSRPMGRVVKPLREMGAYIVGRAGGEYPPLAIQGGRLKGKGFTQEVPSAQVKSALLLAGSLATGETVVREKVMTRDHTERMLSALGADIEFKDGVVRIRGGRSWRGATIGVPGDISAVSFFLALGCLAPDSEVVVREVGLNPTRVGFHDLLRRMGANIEVTETGLLGLEPIGNVIVRSSRLHGARVEGSEVPKLVDEIPALAVAAAFATGTTVITGASELRVKESDRLTALAGNLARFGVGVHEKPDGLIIEGGGPYRGCRVSSFGDHRIGMAMACMGVLCEGETVVEDAECISISFPGFAQVLEGLQ